jgi:RNA polymerase sigma-32 factor
VGSAAHAVASEDRFRRYMQEIGRFELLSAEEERDLARRWRDTGDLDAAHGLVTAHLRLVARIARGFRNYGVPVAELIGDGNLGLMRAVQRFDLERGFRFATYATWWVRAAMLERVLHGRSLVKLGTTAAQRKLFFNLRRLKRDMQAVDEGDLPPEQVTQIARTLAVPEQDVIVMNARLAAPDRSLNAPVGAGSEGEWQDWLVGEAEDQETTIAAREELSGRKALLAEAWKTLGERQRQILIERRLKDEPTPLDALAKQYGVSRERVRQIEVAAIARLRKAMQVPARSEGVGRS